jgi:hypothetical protein
MVELSASMEWGMKTSDGEGTKKLGDPILLDESTLTLAHSLL